MAKAIVTIKIGGSCAGQAELLSDLAAEMRDLDTDYCFLLVHGGGAEVSRLSRRLGLEPNFREGIRVTTGAEMELVEMVLSGSVNKRLVRLFRAAGLNAVGMCGADGGLLTGSPLSENGGCTRTGRIDSVDPKLPALLLAHGYFPVLSPTAVDSRAEALNINADTAAFAVAAALKSETLLFLSDIPGILKQGRQLASLNPAGVEAEIAAGTITGGMIPKVTSALEALSGGVKQIIIGEYRKAGALGALLAGKLGTKIIGD
jgi:acetylglutamate kinase